MSEIFALLSATCFSLGNLAITRGAGPASRDSGAFLSILQTLVLSLAIWLYFSLSAGWPSINTVGLAWFALAGCLTMFFGRVFVYASVQHLGAVRASAVKRLNPLFSVLLGVLLLGESIDMHMGLGMLLIFSSYGMLVMQTLRTTAGRRSGTPARSTLGTLANLGYFFGPAAGLAYAFGYVARKYGLLQISDPALGTFIGALIGASAFIVAAQFLDSYKQALRAAVTTFNPWLFGAGICYSTGQILFFVALNYGTISRVALISSMEVFVTIFLVTFVFRRHEPVTWSVWLAACLGVLGTTLVMWT